MYIFLYYFFQIHFGQDIPIEFLFLKLIALVAINKL